MLKYYITTSFRQFTFFTFLVQTKIWKLLCRYDFVIEIIKVILRYFHLVNVHKKTQLCWSLFLKKVTDLKVCNFIKKRLQHRFFSVNIAKFLRTLTLKNICERLLLKKRNLHELLQEKMNLRENNQVSNLLMIEHLFCKKTTKQKTNKNRKCMG